MALVVDVELEDLAEGVRLSRIRPGGKDGPGGEVHADVPGGQVWTETWALGYPDDEFRLLVPDIRMPPNQYWPLHWHDTWIAIVILDGSCLVGDWWMQPGDVLISAAKLEYGPLVNGPHGCQLFEIFAQDIGLLGGYAPEYHDHPTLTSSGGMVGLPAFLPRPSGSERNAGNQTLPIDGVSGLAKGRLSGGSRWDLGEPGDPSRAVLMDTRLEAGHVYPEHWYRDWRAMFVLGGSMRVGERELGKDDVLIVEPNASVPACESGRDGVHLLEVARTSAAVPRISSSDSGAARSGSRRGSGDR